MKMWQLILALVAMVLVVLGIHYGPGWVRSRHSNNPAAAQHPTPADAGPSQMPVAPTAPDAGVPVDAAHAPRDAATADVRDAADVQDVQDVVDAADVRDAADVQDVIDASPDTAEADTRLADSTTPTPDAVLIIPTQPIDAGTPVDTAPVPPPTPDAAVMADAAPPNAADSAAPTPVSPDVVVPPVVPPTVVQPPTQPQPPHVVVGLSCNPASADAGTPDCAAVPSRDINWYSSGRGFQLHTGWNCDLARPLRAPIQSSPNGPVANACGDGCTFCQ